MCELYEWRKHSRIHECADDFGGWAGAAQARRRRSAKVGKLPEVSG